MTPEDPQVARAHLIEKTCPAGEARHRPHTEIEKRHRDPGGQLTDGLGDKG